MLRTTVWGAAVGRCHAAASFAIDLGLSAPALARHRPALAHFQDASSGGVVSAGGPK